MDVILKSLIKIDFLWRQKIFRIIVSRVGNRHMF